MAELLKTLYAYDRAVIGYHPDADGMASAAMFIKVFSRGKETGLFSIDTPDRSLTTRQVGDIWTFSPEVVVLVDVAPRNLKQLKELADGFTVVVLDRHQYKPEVKNIVKYLLNPHVLCLGSSVEIYSCSKLVYDTLNKISLRWLAVVGLHGDSKEIHWTHFISQFSKQELKAIAKMADIVNLVGTAYKIDGSEEPSGIESRRKELVLLESKTQSAGEFSKSFRSNSLCHLYDLLKNDLRDAVSTIRTNLNRTRLRFIEIVSKSKYNLIDGVLAYVSGQTLKIDEGDTVILYQRGQQVVEYRGITANRKIHCGKLFHDIGGGHRETGGGASNKDPSEIIELLKERIDEQSETSR